MERRVSSSAGRFVMPVPPVGLAGRVEIRRQQGPGVVLEDAVHEELDPGRGEPGRVPGARGRGGRRIAHQRAHRRVAIRTAEGLVLVGAHRQDDPRREVAGVGDGTIGGEL